MTGHQVSVPSRRPAVGAALASIVLAVTALVFPAVASAHSEAGTMTVTKFEQTGPGRVHLEVGIVYQGDGHLAESAVVSATLTSPAGDKFGPVTLVGTGPNSSLYGADIDVNSPGTWSADITSTDPASTASATVEVTAATTTTTPVTTQSTAAPTTQPATTGSTTVATDGAGDGGTKSSSNEGTDNTGLIIAIIAAAVIIAGGLGFAIARKNNQDGNSEPHKGSPDQDSPDQDSPDQGPSGPGSDS